MWHTWARTKDPRLAAFFVNEWEKVQPASRIDARRKPSYAAAQAIARPARNTLSLLVFEAFGSTPNSDDFVLLESELNTAKAKVWKKDNVMAPAKFLQAYRRALKVSRPSSDYLSAFKLVSAKITSAYRFLESGISAFSVLIAKTDALCMI